MKSERTRERIDVLIGGAGFAGLALAIALRQGLGPSFAVAVADPAFVRRAGRCGRASAIVAAARRLFETIGVWEQVRRGATDPRHDRHRQPLQDAVRPVFLRFDGDVEPGEPFAHMIENAPLLEALVAKAKEVGVELQRRRSSISLCLLTAPAKIRRGVSRKPSPSRSPTAPSSRRASWSPRTVRTQQFASTRRFRRAAGIMGNRGSSPRSRMSAIMAAAPKNISCRRDRSRSCR